MSIEDILTQLANTYGQPDASAILANDDLFRSPFRTNNAPESLFYRLEQCQEVAVISNDPYTVNQMMTMSVYLLRAANIFPLKDFEDWEAVAVKTFPALKLFFYAAFTKQMTAISLGHTSGFYGFTNGNLYNIFNTVQVLDSDTTGGNTTTTLAATTTTMPVSTMANTYATTVSTEITNAILQLAANQTAMMSQMSALHITPPVQQIQVPVHTSQTLLFLWIILNLMDIL
jgi:hypothetical protein